MLIFTHNRHLVSPILDLNGFKASVDEAVNDLNHIFPHKIIFTYCKLSDYFNYTSETRNSFQFSINSVRKLEKIIEKLIKTDIIVWQIDKTLFIMLQKQKEEIIIYKETFLFYMIGQQKLSFFLNIYIQANLPYYTGIFYLLSHMNIYLGVTLNESPYKQQCNSNSTIDADSRHQEPFIYWQPMWCQTHDLNTYSNALNICPSCSKIVKFSDQKVISQNLHGRFYLAHAACTSEILQFTEYTRSAKIFNHSKFFLQNLPQIGCKQYLVNFTFQHALTNKCFYQSQKKMLQNQKSLIFQTDERKVQNFEPNFIILPMKQFKCSIKIKPLFKNQNQQNNSYDIYFRVDLSNQQQNVCFMKYQEENAIFIGKFQVIQNKQRRKQIINRLNYKYARPYLEESFVKFLGFSVQFRDSSIQSQIPQVSRASQKEQAKYEKPTNLIQQFQFSYPQKQQIPDQQAYYIQTYEPTQQDELSILFFEQVQFINFIKTQVGSKQFQKRVKSLKNKQIQIIIGYILPHLQEVILNDYANYMFQSLLGTCTFEQRMKIIVKVGDVLTKLVCRQQGTFVFQQLISFLTNKQQFQTICKSIQKDFKIISLDNYGNHFMRKLIQNIPRQMLAYFMPTIYQNFEQLAKNKNAVCVMKSVLKALLQAQTLSSDFNHYMRRFLDTLTLHTPNLINDEFGNYLIQQAYQKIGLQKLRGVSQYIISCFTVYSCERFSNNVVQNCIKKYWIQNLGLFSTLKQCLDNKNIIYMYNNKDGNKILLQIMDLPMEIGLKDKISSVIRNQSPSKYNNRRWVSLTGKCKTGAVGTNYNSFSEAISFSKRKHYN